MWKYKITFYLNLWGAAMGHFPRKENLRQKWEHTGGLLDSAFRNNLHQRMTEDWTEGEIEQPCSCNRGLS